MRTTLDLDEDVLETAKAIARREKKSAGRVVSDLVRRALTAPAQAPVPLRTREPTASYGFKPFASRGKIVSADAIERLRDDGEY